MSALAYTINVSLDGRVLINGAPIGGTADPDETLREIAEQINANLASGAIPGDLLVTLRDERPDGAGYKTLSSSRAQPLNVELFGQMSLLAQAAVEPRPAWALPGAVKLGRRATRITRSLVDDAPELDDSELIAREEARKRRNRRITWAVVGALVVVVGLRIGLSTQWGPNTYAAVCEDARTGLRVDAQACGDTYHFWRYYAPGDSAPKVGDSAQSGLKVLPDATNANKAFPASGGTVSGEGLAEAKS